MNFDLIIIGSGPGGYVAAIRAAQLNLNVAIVERENLGGICLNWGCIPTKALLKSAQVFEYIQHAADYGIQVAGATADFKGMVQRSRTVAEGMSKGVRFLIRKNKITIINGFGKLLRGKQVEVTDSEGKKALYAAKNIIIATGGRAKELPNLKIDGQKIIDYRKAMTLSTQPKSMVVVGAGAIGVEFAYFYNAIGTQVTVVEFMDQGLVPREDADLSKELTKIYTKKGIRILAGTSVEMVDTTGSICKVKVKNKETGATEIIDCEIVLSATGVTPNTENIGLEALGVKMERGFISTDDFYQTNVPGIYAIGDVLATQALAHVASAEGILCVEKIAGKHVEKIDYNNIPGCTYCIPEIASVVILKKTQKQKGMK
jgi:dihydrolipoamide dehydrogenase